MREFWIAFKPDTLGEAADMVISGLQLIAGIVVFTLPWSLALFGVIGPAN